jgi:NodT family efflux transporter outer membrane factor (OMF) lipoprotein
VALIILCGCTVGPDYKLPGGAVFNAPDANGKFLTPDGSTVSDAAPTEHWWRLYNDPMLDGFVQQALAANTDLRVADANLEQSQALLREAKTLHEPSVALVGAVQYAQPAGEQYLLPITPPANTDYEVGATIGYDLDLFGGIRRGIEAATANDQAVEAARDLVRVNVAAQTALAYAGACGAGLQLAAAKHSLALQENNVSLLRILRKGGRALDLDVTRAQQLSDQIATGIPGLEAAQRNALYRLATLTGRTPAQFDRDLLSCDQPPRIAQMIPVGDGTMLLKRRPDVRAAERQLAAATAEIGVATAQLYPDVQIGLSGGSIGVAQDFLKSPTNFWNIGATVNWQANQSAARARVDAANAGAKAMLAHFDGVVLRALRDIEAALNIYVHDLQREAKATSSRDEAQKATSDSKRLEIGGRATAFNVLDAQRSLAAAEQSLAQTQSSISDDQVNVFLALGGGWQSSTAMEAQASVRN